MRTTQQGLYLSVELSLILMMRVMLKAIQMTKVVLKSIRMQRLTKMPELFEMSMDL